ncbi:rap1 GTPase-GDP dissociation stimulator 1-like [Harpia harpyja]|uniref:rap1 GTPase-GDP dissociation stimulator 1-like n=1 Tax=Harpia harpyja TaxID=202280 RepID=UPI0022B0C007|nr:rap1 GTPase-GDP dissociation stimulator 1-like [Harpia harpyja]
MWMTGQLRQRCCQGQKDLPPYHDHLHEEDKTEFASSQKVVLIPSSRFQRHGEGRAEDYPNCKGEEKEGKPNNHQGPARPVPAAPGHATCLGWDKPGCSCGFGRNWGKLGIFAVTTVEVSSWSRVLLLSMGLLAVSVTESVVVLGSNRRNEEQFAYTNIAEELVKLFKKQIEHDKKEMKFEVWAPLAENKVVKLQLVEAGLVECLLEIVRKTADSDKEDDIAELKTASDLTVLLLLGDDSLQKLREGGKGGVFQRVLSWIPSNSHQLQLAGALAIANFARNGGNCIPMLANGVAQKLMDLLDSHAEDGKGSVQHAAPGALRNLAIAVVNKAKMLQDGVAEAVLKCLRSEMPPVQFKLLGTLRMLIDEQAGAAEQLGKNVKRVARLVEWCEAKDHAGVMGESSRLLSALRRHSKSEDVIRTIVQSGGIKHLVTVATSEHVIMQNEALVALALIAALELGEYPSG